MNGKRTVSTESGSRRALVDTRFVGEKVSVDSEGSFDGSVLEEFSLNLFGIRTNRVDARAEVLVLGVRG